MSSKDVNFKIHLKIDGKEHVVEASTSMKKLAQEMEIAQTASTKLRDRLLNLNQTVQAIQNVTSGLRQITGLMQQYTASFALITVLMLNRSQQKVICGFRTIFANSVRNNGQIEG